MTIRTRHAAPVAVLAVTAFALVGCSGGTSPAASESPAPTAEATTSAPASSAPANPAAAGEVTAPGTELKIGDTATVSYENYDGVTGLITLTVTSIDKGTEADLAPLNLGDKAAGMTPYYVRATITSADDAAAGLKYLSIDGDFDGLLKDGSKATPLTVIGSWAACESDTGPGEFTKGTSFDICAPALASGNAEVVGAQYRPSDGEYYDKPIVWK